MKKCLNKKNSIRAQNYSFKVHVTLCNNSQTASRPRYMDFEIL